MRMAIRIHQNTAAARLSLAAISLSQEEFLESNLKESPSGRNLDKATLIFFSIFAIVDGFFCLNPRFMLYIPNPIRGKYRTEYPRQD